MTCFPYEIPFLDYNERSETIHLIIKYLIVLMLEPWTFAACVIVPLLGVAVILALVQLKRSSSHILSMSRQKHEGLLCSGSPYCSNRRDFDHPMTFPSKVIYHDREQQAPRLNRMSLASPDRANSYISYVGRRSLAGQSSMSLISHLIFECSHRDHQTMSAATDKQHILYAFQHNRTRSPDQLSKRKLDLLAKESALIIVLPSGNVSMLNSKASSHESKIDLLSRATDDKDVPSTPSACYGHMLCEGDLANYEPYHYI